MDIIDDIMDWENGDMSEEREIQFFQGLVDTGEARQLQGMYGRQAQRMIGAGLIKIKKNGTKNTIKKTIN